MLSEEKIFNMSEKELKKWINILNQVHITMKKHENPKNFSYHDYQRKAEDVLNEEELLKAVNYLGLQELLNKFNSKYFYFKVEPILGFIIQRQIGRVLNGYQIEHMEIQSSLPINVSFLVGDYFPMDDDLVPHSKGVKDITYEDLEQKIFDSIYNLKYLLNKGQCGNQEHIEFSSKTIKEIQQKYDFYTLNQELNSNENKNVKKIKI
jgi:hypothetical protein